MLNVCLYDIVTWCVCVIAPKVSSKFDEQSEEESEPESEPPSENDIGDTYIDDSPPLSPVPMKTKLPPYFPAIQGCRSVEEFNCLNRIEEGTYGVVYRAKDKKSGVWTGEYSAVGLWETCNITSG